MNVNKVPHSYYHHHMEQVIRRGRSNNATIYLTQKTGKKVGSHKVFFDAFCPTNLYKFPLTSTLMKSGLLCKQGDGTHFSNCNSVSNLRNETFLEKIFSTFVLNVSVHKLLSFVRKVRNCSLQLFNHFSCLTFKRNFFTLSNRPWVLDYLLIPRPVSYSIETVEHYLKF